MVIIRGPFIRGLSVNRYISIKYIYGDYLHLI